MPHRVLVSDANILIDMEEGQLIGEFFALPFEFIIPDILFYEELVNDHEHLLELGLRPEQLTSEMMMHANQLISRYQKPSRNDLFALCLAMNKQCTLLTGDRDLKQAAELEQVEVMGSLGMVRAMLEQELISVERARCAFELMRNTGRRLPWNLVEAMLEEFA